METAAGPEHAWLRQIVGTWSCETTCIMGPGGETHTNTGREIVRAIGDLWVMGELSGEMPDGSTMVCVLTLGFDPTKGCYVGSWIGTPMAQLVTYEGRREGNVLTLDCEGPSFDDPTKTARYQDIVEIRSADERVFSSQILTDDGSWFRFMDSVFRRES